MIYEPAFAKHAYNTVIILIKNSTPHSMTKITQLRNSVINLIPPWSAQLASLAHLPGSRKASQPQNLLHRCPCDGATNPLSRLDCGTLHRWTERVVDPWLGAGGRYQSAA